MVVKTSLKTRQLGTIDYGGESLCQYRSPEGYTESFRATVSDDDNSFDELTVAWYVNEEIVCDWNSVSQAGESL